MPIFISFFTKSDFFHISGVFRGLTFSEEISTFCFFNVPSTPFRYKKRHFQHLYVKFWLFLRVLIEKRSTFLFLSDYFIPLKCKKNDKITLFRVVQNTSNYHKSPYFKICAQSLESKLNDENYFYSSYLILRSYQRISIFKKHKIFIFDEGL